MTGGAVVGVAVTGVVVAGGLVAVVGGVAGATVRGGAAAGLVDAEVEGAGEPTAVAGVTCGCPAAATPDGVCRPAGRRTLLPTGRRTPEGAVGGDAAGPAVVVVVAAGVADIAPIRRPAAAPLNAATATRERAAA